MFYRKNLSTVMCVLALLLFVSSCIKLKIDSPGPNKQTILILPVQLTDTSQQGRHGFYYIYEIVSDPDEIVTIDTRIIPYEAIFKLPIKGDMLIVDTLPPGNYIVDKFIFKTEGSGDYTYGKNEAPRYDKFKLEVGKITIFSKSLDVKVWNETPGHGMSTSYDFDMVPVSLIQKEEILATLKKLPNFDKWKILGES